MHENRFFLPVYIIWFCFYPAPCSMCIDVASLSCLFHNFFFILIWSVLQISFLVFPFPSAVHKPEAIENPLHVPQMKWKRHKNPTLKEKKTVIGTTECIYMVCTKYRAQSTKCGLCILKLNLFSFSVRIFLIALVPR